jgi:hypothetical protein
MDQIQPVIGMPMQATNPLLTRIRIPGETFTIPSGGLFYTNGELAPDVVNGEVHVYPMTGIDELVMKSVDKILNGEAVKEVFARCIPSVLKPGALIAKDVDFLLVALKKVSYGPTFEINYTHDCEDAEMHQYEFPLDMFLRDIKGVNPTTVRAVYTYTLENGQVLNFTPATYDDVVDVYKTQQMEQGKEEVQSQTEVLHGLMSSMSILIADVDGITDRDQIIEWLMQLPVAWLQKISDAAIETTNWGVQFDVPLVCKDCGAEVAVPTPLNPISFFI